MYSHCVRVLLVLPIPRYWDSSVLSMIWWILSYFQQHPSYSSKSLARIFKSRSSLPCISCISNTSLHKCTCISNTYIHTDSIDDCICKPWFDIYFQNVVSRDRKPTDDTSIFKFSNRTDRCIRYSNLFGYFDKWRSRVFSKDVSWLEQYLLLKRRYSNCLLQRAFPFFLRIEDDKNGRRPKGM